MKPLDISFSGGPFRYWRRRGEKHWLAVFMAAAGVACATVLAVTAYLKMQQQDELTVVADNLKQRLAAQQPSELKPALSLAPAKIDAFNVAINKLNIPWRDLFDSIEQATPANIALVSVEPDSAKKALILIAEASSPEAMLDYIGKLKMQPLFTAVILAKHEINKQDPNSPYRFRLEARWKEATQ